MGKKDNGIRFVFVVVSRFGDVDPVVVGSQNLIISLCYGKCSLIAPLQRELIVGPIECQGHAVPEIVLRILNVTVSKILEQRTKFSRRHYGRGLHSRIHYLFLGKQHIQQIDVHGHGCTIAGFVQISQLGTPALEIVGNGDEDGYQQRCHQYLIGMLMAGHQTARPYPFPVQQYEQQHARQSVLPGGKHHDCQE